MPNVPVINQLDPFGDNEDKFRSKEIRHSRSRTFNRFFINLVNPEDKKLRTRNRLILLIGSVTFVAIVVLIIVFAPRLSQPQTPSASEPLVNPTGREAATTSDLPAFDDPETQAYEQEKLDTVFKLFERGDWEYANAYFETIFPNYLTPCGKYDYYRAATILAENITNFTISRNAAAERATILQKDCDRE